MDENIFVSNIAYILADNLCCPTCGKQPEGSRNLFHTYAANAVNHETFECVTPNTEKLKKLHEFEDKLDSMSFDELMKNIDILESFIILTFFTNKDDSILSAYSIADLLDEASSINVSASYQKFNVNSYMLDGFTIVSNKSAKLYNTFELWGEPFIYTKDFILVFFNSDPRIVGVAFNMKDKDKLKNFNAKAKLKL